MCQRENRVSSWSVFVVGFIVAVVVLAAGDVAAVVVAVFVAFAVFDVGMEMTAQQGHNMGTITPPLFILL